LSQAAGTQFTTYAAPRIRGAMVDALRRENPLSRPMAGHVARLKLGQDVLRARLGREATQDELAKELVLSDQRTAEIIGLRSLHVASLDAQADDLVAYLADESASPEDLAIQAMVTRELMRYLALLRPLDREILVRVFWWHQKHIEVAAALGISASRVSQRRSRALKRLRELIDADGWEAACYLRQAA